MKIVVVAGGLSPERDVSLSSGSLIANALREAGHYVFLIDVYEGVLIDESSIDHLFEDKSGSPYTHVVPEVAPNLDEVKCRNNNGDSLIGPNVLKICQVADIAFLALHGAMGENGQIQATFDVLGIKYTGTGYMGSLLAMDKDISKRLMCQAEILTAEWCVFEESTMTQAQIINTIGLPCVVKPCSCGSSIGISMVDSYDELETAILIAKKVEAKILIE
jgi:D-alanine-D-alanine ligase